MGIGIGITFRLLKQRRLEWDVHVQCDECYEYLLVVVATLVLGR